MKWRMRRTMWSFVPVVLMSLVARAQSPSEPAREVIEKARGQRGICVVLDNRPSALAVELAQASDLLIYIQLPDAARVGAALKFADDNGLLGRRIFVGQGEWSHLNLADNLADLVVVGEMVEGSSEAPMAEIIRVLRPGGKALVGDREVSKPFREETDDWSHPYHGPDNNPQSNDKLARAPYLTHFLAEPWYGPMPLVTVASGGRLFKAFGHVAIKQREWPLLNTLVAQNAFNGSILWKRNLSPDFMIHRSTVIATAEALYLADSNSCKILDPATGELRDEIVTAADDGNVWNWMAMADGRLYAMVGQDEPGDPTVRGDRRARGWPWGPPLGKGYNRRQYPWGFGKTIIAMDPATKNVVWRHREDKLIDSRAMCMAAGRVFFYVHGHGLGALDAKSGEVLWHTSDPELLEAIGPHRFAQNPREGFSSSAFVKANDQALYFAGPTRTDLVAVSATDGKLLWRRPEEGNSQLVLRDDGLYAMGPGESAKYDYLTGEVLASLGPRVNCTRATASVDSIFVRGGRDGTMRYDLVNGQQQHLCAMRPSCQDGVLVAHGHLFWGPWMCDCNLTLVGVVSLAPAGDFDFAGRDPNGHRLEIASASTPTIPLEIDPADWPTLRANNSRTAFSTASIPSTAKLLWTFQPRAAVAATGPTSAGDMIFVGNQDGAVRALDARTGDLRWTAYTGGPIHYPPTLWQGRAFVGSGDGWVYCLDASSGRRLWRFRAAPAERMIPVYGSLTSTWPVASGVLVEDGVAYAAAGIANHDGTHVFALDAETGQLRWHNHSSGSLDPRTGSGVSVNGHLLRHGAHLYLAGGNMAPVARYALADGKCTTDPHAPNSHTQFTAGSDLFLVGDDVQSGGPPLHSGHGDYRLVNRAVFQTAVGKLVLAYGPHDSRLALFEGSNVLTADARRQAAAKPKWQSEPLNRICGIAMTAKAVALAGLKDPSQVGDLPASHLVVLSAADGAAMWSHSLPAPPVPWGLLVDRDGRVVVCMEDGRVACFGSSRQ